MIQRKYVELNKKGCWTLFRIDYFYRNEPYFYYELYQKQHGTNPDNIIRFGDKKFNQLKLMLQDVTFPMNRIPDKQI